MSKNVIIVNGKIKGWGQKHLKLRTPSFLSEVQINFIQKSDIIRCLDFLKTNDNEVPPQIAEPFAYLVKQDVKLNNMIVIDMLNYLEQKIVKLFMLNISVTAIHNPLRYLLPHKITFIIENQFLYLDNIN